MPQSGTGVAMTRDESSGSKRTDLSGAFVTRRAARVGRERTWRLQVDDGERVCYLLLHPDRGDIRFDLRTGDEYVFADVRVCRPLDEVPRIESECAACDGELREWAALDDYPWLRGVVDEFDMQAEFYLVDEASTVYASSLDRVDRQDVSEWRPWRSNTPAGVVCTGCGREYGTANPGCMETDSETEPIGSHENHGES